MTAKTKTSMDIQNVSIFPAHVPFNNGSIIVLTGDPGVGKTTFGTSAVPRSRLAYLDGESSGATTMAANPPAYYSDINRDYWIQNPKHTKIDSLIYTDLWLKRMDEIEASAENYSVVTIDNINSLRANAITWAYAHAKEYGWRNTSDVKFMWGYVNAFLAERLQRLASKVGMLILITHLQEEFGDDDKPTGVVIPKIWGAIEERASLVLWLRHGAFSPVPDALVMKGRAIISVDAISNGSEWIVSGSENFPAGVMGRLDEELSQYDPSEEPFVQVSMPIFPQVIRGVTWQRVRYYCNNPYQRFAPEEGETPSDVEYQIITKQPSEFAKDSRKLALLQAQQAAAEAQAIDLKLKADIKAIFLKFSDKEMAVKEEVKAHFGSYSTAIHTQVVDYLRAKYPDVLG